MNASDHERCSELLRDHVQGRLGAPEESWVADHLAGCSDCRAEEAALRAVTRAEVAPLTEVERARLRRSVLAVAPASAAEVAPSTRSARGGRMLQLLGAAALLVMIGGFLYTTGLSGGDDGGFAGSGADSAESGEAPAAGDSRAVQESGEGASRSAGGSAETLDAAALPQPTFRRSLGEVTGRRLNILGRQGLPLVVFSRAYRAEQVPELQTEFRDQLAAAAGPLGDSVRECSDLVTQAFPNALPAYGALATLEKLGDDEVLVLAFAWTDQPSGPLDQSMVWAWPADNCDQPVEYYKNVIEPRR